MYEVGDTQIEVAVGALDDASRAEFTEQIGIESRLPAFQTLHLLPEVRTEATRKPEDLAKLTSLQHPDHDESSARAACNAASALTPSGPPA